MKIYISFTVIIWHTLIMQFVHILDTKEINSSSIHTDMQISNIIIGV